MAKNETSKKPATPPDAALAEDSATPAAAKPDRRARWWVRRGGKRSGFWYQDARGARVTDEEQIERVRALAIPPAWKDVRVSPSPRSKLQATGVDAMGRLQYKYNPAHAARQAARKYEKIERFGEHLPGLRRASNEHLSTGEELTRERVLAVVVRLINDLYFRVGSEQSVARYRTYGVTTLRNRHLEIRRGGVLEFSFVGKHHVRHRRVVVDKELAAIVGEIKKLKGPRLFQYVGEDGRPRAITPRDVNEYIKVATAPEFSAKDFRTWGGTLLAAVELADAGAPASEAEAKRNLVRAVKRVAERLGNTPAVCRASYVHPRVLDLYGRGVTLDEFRPKGSRATRRLQPELEPEEASLLKLFRD